MSSTTDTATPTDEPSLQIRGLRISNYKRIVAVDLHPDGRGMVLGGRNMQGKSSILDAIADALGGAKRGSKTELALRTGSVRGEVRVDLGAYLVTRTWSPSGDKLVVESPPGSPLKSPQAVLDRFVGDNSFDPLAFARQDPRTFTETLRRLSGLDTREIDARRGTAYAERTTINGQLKRARTMRDELIVPPEPAAIPGRPSITELLGEEHALRGIIAECIALEAIPGSLEAAIGSLDREIAERIELVSASASRIKSAMDTLDFLRAAEVNLQRAKASQPLAGLDATPALEAVAKLAIACGPYIETQGTINRTAEAERQERLVLKTQAEAELEEVRKDAAGATTNREATERGLERIAGRIADADAANARAEAAQREHMSYQAARADWKHRDNEVARLSAESDRLTGIITEADEAKQRAVAAAHFPIDGLGIDGDTAMYLGVPFAQASQAQKLRVGVAVGVALNPALKIALVREGAFLDDDGLADLLAACIERGVQPWVEVVGSRDAGEGVGIIIEDGRVLEEA